MNNDIRIYIEYVIEGEPPENLHIDSFHSWDAYYNATFSPAIWVTRFVYSTPHTFKEVTRAYTRA